MNDSSFEQYGAARMRLAGEKIADSTDMCFVPWDGLGEHSAQQPISFAHYDYLGLSENIEVVEAATRAVEQSGTSASASRFVGGERVIHGELEAELAEFLNAGDALCLVSGYLTNITLIPHLVGRRDLVIIDEFAHNSLFAGARQSSAEVVKFKHNDLDDLEAILSRYKEHAGKTLVVVESLYSMDGDIVDLPRALEIKNRFGAWLMVDEAHSFGVLGATGRGLGEYFGCDPNDIEVRTGTLSKAFVSAGGFILASKKIIRWLRYTLPGFVYSVGLPPSSTAAALQALRVIKSDPERVERMRARGQYFLGSAKVRGLETGTAIGMGIVPVIFRQNDDVLRISEGLFRRGIYVPPIARIGVPEASPRLRFFISSRHSEAEINTALEALTAVKLELSPNS